MGHNASKAHHQQEEAPPSSLTRAGSGGLVPRSETARRSCELKRVKKLIKTDLLAPCWQPIADGQGCECPVCMEGYGKLNHTACCHQDICTECFINIVADSAGARCPYCQADALQVYLPSGDSKQAGSRARSGRRAEPSTRASSVCPQQQQRQAAAAAAPLRLAAGSSFFGGSAKGAAPLDPSQAPCMVLLLPASLSTLAEAAAGASRQLGCPLVGMVLTQERPRYGSSSGGGGGEAPVAPLPGPAGLASPAGGPALLLNPDGTGQLVLLSSGEGAAPAAAPQAEQPPLPSYQAPANPEDDRMRAAIARGDSALRRQQPAPRPRAAAGGAGGSGDWLARMQAADAAVRQAVARNDAQRFGGDTP